MDDNLTINMDDDNCFSIEDNTFILKIYHNYMADERTLAHKITLNFDTIDDLKTFFSSLNKYVQDKCNER